MNKDLVAASAKIREWDAESNRGMQSVLNFFKPTPKSTILPSTSLTEEISLFPASWQNVANSSDSCEISLPTSSSASLAITLPLVTISEEIPEQVLTQQIVSDESESARKRRRPAQEKLKNEIIQYNRDLQALEGRMNLTEAELARTIALKKLKATALKDLREKEVSFLLSF